ncbi:MAG: hypothetical protein AAFU85_17090, partial [Planctomycetota bacterium]
MRRRLPECASPRHLRKRARVRRALFQSLEDRRLLAADPLDPNCVPPVLNAPAQVAVPENSTFVVDIDATDNLDSEGSGLTYGLDGGDDVALFSIDSMTGVLEFAVAPNFEAPGDLDMDNVYQVVVTVEDSDQLITLASIDITVNDINESPVADADGPYEIDAGVDLDVDASGTTDEDIGETFTFEWDFNSDGNVDFTTNDPAETVPWLTLVDHVSIGTNQVTLTVTDSAGNPSSDTTTLEVAPTFTFEPLSDGNADNYTLSLVSGELQINDTTAGLLSRVGITGIQDIEINGGDDQDTLTIDFGGGFIALPITFDGGAPTTLPGDTLVITDSSASLAFPLVEHSFSDPNSGTVDVIETTQSSLITYTGLEPVMDNLGAVDRTFTFLGDDEIITLSDEGVAANNMNRIDSTLGELVDFINPTNSLTVNTGTGVDVFTLSTLDSMTAFPSLTINGGDAADILNIEALPAAITAELNGGAENDTFNIGSGTLDAILGDINILGGGSVAALGDTESITAKGVTVTAMVSSGDILNIDDSASALNNTYAVGAGTIQRTAVIASGTITHNVQETNVVTGTGDDIVLVATTTQEATTNIDTGAGADTVTVTTTGNDSIARIDTGADNDTVNITTTGAMSATDITTAAGDDDVNVTTTGDSSGLSVDTGIEIDLVSLLATGASAVTAVTLGDGADVANIQSTAAASVTDLFAGAGNDTINISSDADGDRISTSGDPAGNLDGILGEICVFGEVNDAAPDNTTTITAKGTDVTVTIARGDELNISDEASVADNDYTLTDLSFERVGAAAISYETIESLNLETGSGNDTVEVTTIALARTTLNAFAGTDTVNITDTAAASILIVDTGTDSDVVNVTDTGTGSATTIATAAGDDDVNVTTTGDSSGLSIDTGADIDLVNLFATGASAVTAITLGDGADVANIQSTAAGSVTDLFAGAGNDTINISSDADGDRISTSGDPAGNLDGILGEICVFGEANEAAPDNTTTITAKATDVTVTIVRGDELNISDEASVTDNDYTLTDVSFERVGAAVISYETVESLNLETGGGNDTVQVTTTALARTTLTTFAGTDTVNITDTAAASILIVDTGADSDVVNITDAGAGSATTIATAAGDDDVNVTTTGDSSGLSIDTGADI